MATGIAVRKGDRVRFDTTGEVRLSNNGTDLAHAAGAGRYAISSPLPRVYAGALIGRIGVNGQPFGIGNQTVVPMPDAGLLYLAVNDDERSDNAGEFVVVINGMRR